MSPPKRGTGAWASDIRSSPQGGPADHRKIDRACAGRQHRQSECDGGGLRTVDKNVHGIVPIRPCSCASTQACGRPVGALQTRLRFFTFSLGGPGPLRRGRGINQLFTFEGEPVLFTFEEGAFARSALALVPCSHRMSILRNRKKILPKHTCVLVLLAVLMVPAFPTPVVTISSIGSREVVRTIAPLDCVENMLQRVRALGHAAVMDECRPLCGVVVAPFAGRCGGATVVQQGRHFRRRDCRLGKVSGSGSRSREVSRFVTSALSLE